MPRVRLSAGRSRPTPSGGVSWVGRRAAALDAALTAGGAPGLLPTYEMVLGSHAGRLFAQAVIDSGFLTLDFAGWPCEGASVGDLAATMVFREGSSAIYRLEDGTLALFSVEYGWARLSLAGTSEDAVASASSMFRTVYPATYLDATDDRVPVTFWSLGPHGPIQRLRMIDASPWETIRRNYAGAVAGQLDDLMDGFEPGKGGLLLLWQGLPGTGKCVAGGTRIVTAWGYHRIDELHPARTPDTAWEFAADVGTPDGLKRTSHFYVGGAKPTKIIRTKQGYEIEGTHEHPLFALRPSGRIEWVRCDEITTDDYVCVAREVAAWGAEDVPDAYMLGVFVGDGHLVSGRRALLSTADPEIAEAWQDFARRHGARATLRAGTYDWSVEAVAFVAHLGRCGIKAVLGPDKTVPDPIWRASRQDVASFLRGLFDADGSAASRDGSIEFCSSSAELVREIQLLLLKFGIVGSRRRRRTSHVLKGERRRGNAYRLTLRGADAALFYGEIGFGLARKQAGYTALPSSRNTNEDVVPYVRDRLVGYRRDRNPSYPMLQELVELHPENLADPTVAWSLSHHPFWSRVETVEDSEAEVFDLTVPDGHSFVANGIVSHNTWALRALVSEWLPWAEFHYITDPDSFFVEDASYMIDVLLADSYEAIHEPTGDVVYGEAGEQGKWRVLILEDTGELLSANAKEKYGQGLSRLLNVVDGLIGQGLRVLVLVTTNDELGELNPAVRRAGRCASQIEFVPMTVEEAAEWLGVEDVAAGTTLADLYARAGVAADAIPERDHPDDPEPEDARDLMASGCRCEACAPGAPHASDCAVHGGPALAPGPCDCGALVASTGDVAAEIRRVAGEHAPDGGYGETWWSDSTKTVFWNAADWTSNEEAVAAEAAFLSVDGVRAFRSDAEVARPDGEDGADDWALLWPDPDSDLGLDRVVQLASRDLVLETRHAGWFAGASRPREEERPRPRRR